MERVRLLYSDLNVPGIDDRAVLDNIRGKNPDIPFINLTAHATGPLAMRAIQEGTGLGLSISYRIIQHCKGEIQVENELGKGATFAVILPMNLEKVLEGENDHG
jgi:two-component system NtrC family sensor kinase